MQLLTLLLFAFLVTISNAIISCEVCENDSDCGGKQCIFQICDCTSRFMKSFDRGCPRNWKRCGPNNICRPANDYTITDGGELNRNSQFTRIGSRSAIPFKKEGCATTKYIAIYRMHNGRLDWIAEGHPVGCNESVIATKNGDLAVTKMGELWVDTSGNRH